MRKILLIFLIISIGFSLYSCRTSQPANAVNKTAEIYFVDSEMLRLIPTTIHLKNQSTKKACERVIDELIKGRDDNKKILRLIPNKKNIITVEVDNDTACVNLTKNFIQEHPDGINNEVLTIYSIVNSLCSLDGIKKVKFTIDGKVEQKFKGHIDMRETFVPDYSI